MSGLPLKEKIGKMTVCLDKNYGGTELAEINFNMADFKFGEFKMLRLYMQKCKANDRIDIDPETTFLDIGLRGTVS